MNFLVYEHWRPDTQSCFYVGKGKLRRAKSFEARNSRYERIVGVLRRLGMTPEIKIVADGLTESDAILLEIERIAYWRRCGIAIANYTDGGDGTSGRFHSQETRQKIRARAIGRKVSEETRAKMSAIRLGTKRSDDTRAKQSASAKIAQKKRFEKMKETKAGEQLLRRKMIKISRKAATDPKVRAVRSVNAKGLWADPRYRDKVIAARAESRRRSRIS